MKRSDLSSGTFLLLLSLFILSQSLAFPFGTLSQPETGFLPSILGFLLAILSLVLLVRSLPRQKRKWVHFGRGFFEVLAAASGMVLYAVFLQTLGYLIATSLMGLFLLTAVEKQHWTRGVIFSLVYGVISYFGFKALGVYLPAGPIYF